MTSSYVDVAVPLPLDAPLTYGVPAGQERLAQRGSRARVRVGKRKLTGLIVGEVETPPEGVTIRDLELVVDLEPILTPELLELADFIAEYYMAPIGEVVRAMLPAGLAPWGDQRIRLTDAGALAPSETGTAAAVIGVLLERGPMSLAELHAAVDEDDLAEAVRDLERRQLAVITRPEARGSRYVSAVELAARPLDELLEACGRSQPGRRVVEYLHHLKRPATVSEVLLAVECTDGVVRRLIRLDVLHKFTQLERLALERHLTAEKESKAITLRPDQQNAVDSLIKALGSGEYRPFLLAGMTGSGKTEVYLRVVQQALDTGKGSILLVPEISLVPALARTVRARFGERLAILHSGLSRAERHQEWERIRSGEAQVVLGPRSAVFAPVRNLAFIAVDEEQDSSYKQETTPRYHGRDIALVRARDRNAVALLVSATPSLESRLNAERGRLGFLALTERVGQGELPAGVLVDLKQTAGPRRSGEVVFSDVLCEEIEQTLGRDEQVILLRNRRGYAPVLLCRACGNDHECDDCGLPRTLHRRPSRLLCHYCASALPVPERCQACDETALEAVGAGTERVEETFRELFPAASVEVLDRDAVSRVGSTRLILDRFGRRQTQVLIGTQMVTKGHHFPGVSLTGVLQADSYLSFPDFRAVERTYALLTQLAGRAGRGQVPGKIVIQTFHPDHYAIQAALKHDDEAFAEQEMRFRRIFHYPPYTRMTQLLVRGKRRESVAQDAERIARRLEQRLAGEEVRISGPAPAPFERLQGKWRYQLLVRGRSPGRLRTAVQSALATKLSSEVAIDVDPYQLL